MAIQRLIPLTRHDLLPQLLDDLLLRGPRPQGALFQVYIHVLHAHILHIDPILASIYAISMCIIVIITSIYILHVILFEQYNINYTI